jgi:hypothetical protein
MWAPVFLVHTQRAHLWAHTVVCHWQLNVSWTLPYLAPTSMHPEFWVLLLFQVLTSHPYTDPQYGGIFASYRPQAMVWTSWSHGYSKTLTTERQFYHIWHAPYPNLLHTTFGILHGFIPIIASYFRNTLLFNYWIYICSFLFTLPVPIQVVIWHREQKLIEEWDNQDQQISILCFSWLSKQLHTFTHQWSSHQLTNSAVEHMVHGWTTTYALSLFLVD